MLEAYLTPASTGSSTRSTPPYGERIEQRIRHRGFTWIDDAGHLLPEDAPAQLIQHLTAAI